MIEFVFAVAALVGVIDGGPVALDNVRTVASVEVPTSFEHGKIVIDTMRKAAGENVPVLYVSAFEAGNGAVNDATFDYQTAYKGMIEMQRQGVKYICTTFVTDDISGATDFVNFANQLGLKVVASLGNGEVAKPYPAMLPGVIAVAGSEAKLSKAVKARADYTISGKIDGGVQGSSYAVAKFCGKGII